MRIGTTVAPLNGGRGSVGGADLAATAAEEMADRTRLGILEAVVLRQTAMGDATGNGGGAGCADWSGAAASVVPAAH